MNSQFDFLRCEDEPIHIPGKIQPLGYFLALNKNNNIVYVSENINSLGLEPKSILNTSVSTVFPDIYNTLIEFYREEEPEKRKTYFDVNIQNLNRCFDLYISQKDNITTVEIIDANNLTLNTQNLECIDIIQKFTTSLEIKDLFGEIVTAIKELTAYDRVMLYRFDPQYNGQVIAEAKESHLEPYLNLHYPASDIPIQARQLYLKNPIRVIKDVNYTPIGIMANSDEAIDMGMSFLRSVSPIHLQYMKNMGVHASMTISIIIEGKLWGLIACHHQSPYLPETKTVYTCEKISHVISSLINMFQQQNSQKRKAKFLATIDTITSLLKSNIHTYNISAFIRQNLSMFLPLFNANGLIVYSDDTIESINIELDNYKINKLTNNIISLLKENTFVTTSLATHLKLEEDILTTCAGIVAIKIEEFDTVFIFTRVQQVQTIEWGGDPTKPAQDLTPRTSFEKFSQTVTQKSLPWSETIETKLDIFREKLREIFILQSSQQTIKVQQNVISTLEKEKTKNQAQLIDMLIAMIEQRDAYTAGHTQRVAQFCTLIASHLGCTQSEIEMLDQAAKLHDLGKISIPDSVLLKPGRLSNNEYGLIKMHLDVGYEILNKIDYYKEIAHIMCHHHEKYDGTGYPSGKKAEEIPLLGHIMIVADALDAMTTNRVYQARKTVDEALKEIEYLSGKWYHPKVVDAIKHLHIAGKITASFASQMPLTQIEQERFSYFFKDQLTSFFNESYLWMILNKSIPNKNIEHFAMVEIHGMTSYNKTHGWLMGSQLINSVAKQINNIHQGSNKFRVFGDDFVLGFISKEKKRAFVSLWQEVKFKNIHTSTKEVQKNDLIAEIQMIL